MQVPVSLLKRACCLFIAAAAAFTFTAAAYADVPAALSGNTALSDKTAKEYKSAEKEIKSALNKFEPSVQLDAEISKDDISELFLDILIENTQYFYAASEITYTYSVSTGIVKTVNFNYIMDKTEARKNRSAFNKAFKSYVTGADKKWSDLQKALYIHDRLAASCKYDTTVQAESYTAFGALVKGLAVCQGYSIAYAQLLNELGVECGTVYSFKDNHMWNSVKVNGFWYNVDVTYDDPLPDLTNQVYHSFFLKSAAALNFDKRHNATYAEGGVAGWSTSFDKAFWNDVKGIMPVADSSIYYVSPSGEVSAYGVDTRKTITIYKVSDLWKIYGTNSYYEGIFSACALYGKRLYFNTSDSIYSFNRDNYQLTKEKTVSTKNGCLYGVMVDKGSVYGLIKDSPIDNTSEKWEKLI